VSIVNNTGLDVDVGMSALLKTTHLSAATNMDVSLTNLTFVVFAPPRHGLLTKLGRPVARFSLSELRRHQVKYEHSGSDDPTGDEFGFRVEAGIDRVMVSAENKFQVFV